MNDFLRAKVTTSSIPDLLLPKPEVESNTDWNIIFFDSTKSESGSLGGYIVNSFSHLDRHTLEVITYNLLCCHLLDLQYSFKEPILCSVSRSSKHYKSPPRVYDYPHISLAKLTSAIDTLITVGYISQKIGFRDKGTKVSKSTKIHPTDTFRALVTQHLAGINIIPVKVRGKMLLKEGSKGNKRLARYIPNLFTSAKTSTLEAINWNNSHTFFEGHNLQHRIYTYNNILPPLSVSRGNNPSNSSTHLPISSILNDRGYYLDFDTGGRFDADFHGKLKREERATLTIDGLPTVELDFSCIFPRMLYHELGLKPQGDLYTLGTTLGVDRWFYKKSLNIMLNCVSKDSAIAALGKAIREHNNGKSLADHKVLPKPLTSRDIIEDVSNAHPKLSKYFYKSMWRRLQNLESDIAELVMFLFAMNFRACLSIHDSFIVQLQHEDILRQTMIEVYQSVVDTTYLPEIDIK